MQQPELRSTASADDRVDTEVCLSGADAPPTAPQPDWLDTATARLVRTFDPDLILLFGSRARGTATRRSDLDLLIACDTTEPPLCRIGRVLSLLSDSPWPVEALVYTSQELAAIAHRPFVRRILSEGRLLYER